MILAITSMVLATLIGWGGSFLRNWTKAAALLKVIVGSSSHTCYNMNGYIYSQLIFYKNNEFTSAGQPLVAVCVQGFGPQLLQVTISFGPVVPVAVPPSLFFLPCDRVIVEETFIFKSKCIRCMRYSPLHRIY